MKLEITFDDQLTLELINNGVWEYLRNGDAHISVGKNDTLIIYDNGSQIFKIGE